MKTRDQSSLHSLFREVLDKVWEKTHGNVYFGVANGTPCAMHLSAWDDSEEEHSNL
jgi:hypothetical protein